MAKLSLTAMLALLPSLAAAVVHAGTSDWELSEVQKDASATSLGYVELRNLAGGCLFPSTRLELFNSAGQLIDSSQLVATTSCFGAPTYFLAATLASASAFGTERDANLLLSAASLESGQLCLSSSGTRYDCTRWGTIAMPVPDLFGAGDGSSASNFSGDIVLARQQTTHIVADDWSLSTPSPRQPNDGTTWDPPDAGPLPDAGRYDAGHVDAGPRPDAMPRRDAGGQVEDPRYLDLDPGGGATCGCTTSGLAGLSNLLMALLLVLGLRRRSRQRR